MERSRQPIAPSNRPPILSRMPTPQNAFDERKNDTYSIGRAVRKFHHRSDPQRAQIALDIDRNVRNGCGEFEGDQRRTHDVAKGHSTC